MTREELKTKLIENHKSFISIINSLSDIDFVFSVNEKWTAGQQADHLLRAVEPINKIFIMPKITMSVMFGKANRSSKSFEELVEKYKLKLSEGGKASGQFVPPTIALNEKEKLLQQLLKAAEKLCKHLDDFTEAQLDEYILPHPLLGKLTLREMIYFTIYHVEHHQKITLRNLEK